MARLAEQLAASLSGGAAALICSEAALRQTADTGGFPPLTILPSI